MFEFLKELIAGGMVNATEGMNYYLRWALCWGSFLVYLVVVLAIVFVVSVVIGFIVLSIAMRTPLRPYLVEFLGLDTVKSLKEYKARKKTRKRK